MSDEERLLFDEYEFAKFHGLEIEKGNRFDVDALLLSDEAKIYLLESLPDIQQRVYIVHEIFHYITKNYLATKDIPHLDIVAYDSTLLDAFYKEKQYAETRYANLMADLRKYVGEESEKEPGDEEMLVAIDRIDATARQTREEMKNIIRLDYAYCEYQTWLMTERYYNTRNIYVCTWSNVEAVSFCCKKMEGIANSSLDVITECRKLDHNALKALETDLAYTPRDEFNLYPALHVGLERNLNNIKASFSSREQYFREQEYRWRNLIIVCRQWEREVLERYEGGYWTQRKYMRDERQSVLAEGGLFFEPLYRFNDMRGTIADTIRNKLINYYQGNKRGIETSVRLEGDIIRVYFNDNRTISVTNEGITYSIPFMKGWLSAIKSILKAVNLIRDYLGVRIWINMGVKFIEWYKVPEEERDSLWRRLQPSQDYGIALEEQGDVQKDHLESTMGVVLDGIEATVVIGVKFTEDIFYYTVDFRTLDIKKYKGKWWDFVLDSHGLMLDSLDLVRDSVMEVNEGV